ncbi:MAG: hypothetical protein JNM89_01160 [Hyphomicrobiaceae bacterium]|jgi:hypothetical protein|nr:hypothetical protein [Hyphomicrobiaceae bacterium]
MSQQADEPSTREMAQTLKQLGANSRWHLSGSSRVLQIVLIAHVRPLNSQIASASELLQAVFQSDAAAIEWSIGETIRQRAAAYFPAEYTIFVRVDLLDRGDSARVVFWTATPRLSRSAAVFARRSWSLLLPIFEHVTLQGFQERLEGIRVEIIAKSNTVTSFAPRRLLTEPLVIIGAAGLLTTLYWLLVHPNARGWLGF